MFVWFNTFCTCLFMPSCLISLYFQKLFLYIFGCVFFLFSAKVLANFKELKMTTLRHDALFEGKYVFDTVVHKCSTFVSCTLWTGMNSHWVSMSWILHVWHKSHGIISSVKMLENIFSRNAVYLSQCFSTSGTQAIGGTWDGVQWFAQNHQTSAACQWDQLWESWLSL